MGRIKDSFSNLKLRNKFIVAYALLLIIPLLLTGVLFYGWIARVTREQVRQIALQTVKQAQLHIAYIREQAENLGNMIFWDKEFRELLKEKDTILYEQVEEYQTIINTVMRMEENPVVYRVRLYVPDSKIYARNNQHIFPISSLQENQFFHAINEKNKVGWTNCYSLTGSDGKKARVISYVVVLNDYDDFKQVIGCLFIDVLEEEFYTVLSGIKIADNGSALMINSDGDNILSTYNSKNGLDDAINMYSAYSESKGTQQESFNNYRWNGTYFTIINTPIDGSNWEIVYIMPTSESMKSVEASIKFTVFIITACVLLAAAIAVVVSNRITKGINDLIDRMEKVQEIGIGIPQDRTTEYSKDEIGQLQHHFNLMMERIRNLVKENYEVQLQKREAQLKALQAQINPHFLYNVLDSINWMAIRAGAMNISDMVTDLGRFYRIGLSGGKEVISIREELEHVKTYLKIQKVRFAETIDVFFDVPEDILDYSIVKLTLQPIVENAIVHRILSKPTQEGIIKISGSKKEEEIMITIVDDGIGVDFNKVRYILSDPNSQFSKGFGIKNVNERIKLYFGQQYGVEIKREQNQWTKVEIRLPAKGYM